MPPAPCPHLGTPLPQHLPDLEMGWKLWGTGFLGGCKWESTAGPSLGTRSSIPAPENGGPCALPQLIGALSCFPPAPAGQTVLCLYPPIHKQREITAATQEHHVTARKTERGGQERFRCPPQCHGIRESPAPGPVLARWLFGDCSAPVIFSR